MLLQGTGRPREAEEAYRRALVVQSKLAGEFPEVSAYRQAEAQSYFQLGLLLQDTGQHEAAEEAGHKALTLREKLATDFPRQAILRQELALSEEQQGRLQQEAGRFPEAEKSYRQALTLREQLVADFPTVAFYRTGLALGLDQLGAFLKDAGRSQEAKAIFRRERTLWEHLVAEYPQEVEYRLELAWFLATCPDPGLRDAGRAVQLARQVVDEAPQEGVAWAALGVACYRAGNWQDARAALEKAMPLRGGGDGRDWFVLAMTSWQLHQHDEARRWFHQAQTWLEQHRSAAADVERFRAEAEALLGSDSGSNARRGPATALPSAGAETTWPLALRVGVPKTDRG
jgi:tetratricopeptide (TPR) repeat protein